MMLPHIQVEGESPSGHQKPSPSFVPGSDNGTSASTPFERIFKHNWYRNSNKTSLAGFFEYVNVTDTPISSFSNVSHRLEKPEVLEYHGNPVVDKESEFKGEDDGRLLVGSQSSATGKIHNPKTENTQMSSSAALFSHRISVMPESDDNGKTISETAKTDLSSVTEITLPFNKNISFAPISDVTKESNSFGLVSGDAVNYSNTGHLPTSTDGYPEFSDVKEPFTAGNTKVHVPVSEEILDALLPVIQNMKFVVSSTEKHADNVAVIMENTDALLPVTIFPTETIVPGTEGITEILVPVMEGVTETVLPVREGVTETVVSVMEGVTETAVPVMEGVTETAVPVMESVTETAVPVMEGVTESVVPVMEGVTETVIPVMEGKIETVVPVMEGVTETVLPVMDDVTETVVPVMEGVTETVVPVMEGVTETVALALKSVTETIVPEIESVTETIVPIMEGVTETVVPIMEGVTETVAPIMEGVTETVAPVMEENSGTVTPIAEVQTYTLHVSDENIDIYVPISDENREIPEFTVGETTESGMPVTMKNIEMYEEEKIGIYESRTEQSTEIYESYSSAHESKLAENSTDTNLILEASPRMEVLQSIISSPLEPATIDVKIKTIKDLQVDAHENLFDPSQIARATSYEESSYSTATRSATVTTWVDPNNRNVIGQGYTNSTLPRSIGMNSNDNVPLAQETIGTSGISNISEYHANLEITTSSLITASDRSNQLHDLAVTAVPVGNIIKPDNGGLGNVTGTNLHSAETGAGNNILYEMPNLDRNSGLHLTSSIVIALSICCSVVVILSILTVSLWLRRRHKNRSKIYLSKESVKPKAFFTKPMHPALLPEERLDVPESFYVIEFQKPRAPVVLSDDPDCVKRDADTVLESQSDGIENHAFVDIPLEDLKPKNFAKGHITQSQNPPKFGTKLLPKCNSDSEIQVWSSTGSLYKASPTFCHCPVPPPPYSSSSGDDLGNLSADAFPSLGSKSRLLYV